MTAGIGATLNRVQSLASRFQGLATPGASTEPSITTPGYGHFRPSGFRPAPVLPPALTTSAPPAERRPARVVSTRGTTAGAPNPARFDELIDRYGEQYGVDPNLVRAVARAESGFNPQAISRAGAKGLMQLMDGTAQRLGVSDSFDPVQNVRGGVTFLRQLLDRYGDTGLALAAYNAGPGAVDRYGGVPPYSETQTYVSRVFDYLREYQANDRTPSRIDRKG